MKRKRLIVIPTVLLALFCSVLVVKIPVVASALDGPGFCGSCHAMEPQVDTYLHGVHNQIATCGDCHMPHGVVSGAYYKAYSGAKDVFFVMMGHTNNIQSTTLGKDIVQENCISCHGDLTLMIENAESTGRYCFDCHRNVRHTK